MSIANSESKLTFTIGGKDAGASNVLKNIGKEFDAVTKKAQQTAKAATPDRFKGMGKFFEMTGLGGKAAGAFEVASGGGGMGATAFKAAGLAAAALAMRQIGENADKIDNAFRRLADGTMKWNDALGDAFRSLPILGDFVKGFDGIKNAVTGAGEALRQLEAENQKRKKELDKTDEQWRKIREGGAAAREQLYVAAGGTAAAQTFRQAQIDYFRENDRISALAKAPGAKSGLLAQEIAAMRAANDQKIKAAQDQMIQAERQLALKQHEERDRAAKEDRIRAVEAAKETADAVARAAAEREGKMQDVQSRIAEIVRANAPSRGALAEGASVGMAAIFSSRERSSADAFGVLRRDFNTSATKQIQILQGVLDELKKGNNSVAMPVFN